MGKATYFGPCTPPGDWHHYTLTLIATDLDPKALQPGMTREELFDALKGHTKGAAGLIPRFTHPRADPAPPAGREHLIRAQNTGRGPGKASLLRAAGSVGADTRGLADRAAVAF